MRRHMDRGGQMDVCPYIDLLPPAELASGIEASGPWWRPPVEAGSAGFVEQEGYDMPPFEALRIDAECIRALHAQTVGVDAGSPGTSSRRRKAITPAAIMRIGHEGILR